MIILTITIIIKYNVHNVKMMTLWTPVHKDNKTDMVGFNYQKPYIFLRILLFTNGKSSFPSCPSRLIGLSFKRLVTIKKKPDQKIISINFIKILLATSQNKISVSGGVLKNEHKHRVTSFTLVCQIFELIFILVWIFTRSDVFARVFKLFTFFK